MFESRSQLHHLNHTACAKCALDIRACVGEAVDMCEGCDRHVLDMGSTCLGQALDMC